MSAPRRRKTAKACSACRKLKARCEPSTELSEDGLPEPCHRCKTLFLECCFEGQDPIPPIQPSKKRSTTSQALQLQAKNILSKFDTPLSITFQNERITIKQLPVTQWYPPNEEIRFYCRQGKDERWIGAIAFPSSVCSNLISRNPVAKVRNKPNDETLTSSQLQAGPERKVRKTMDKSETKGSVPLAEVVALLDSNLEYQLMSVFAGLYSPFLPCLSLGEEVPTSLKKVVSTSISDSFFLSSIYLTAIPHLTDKEIVSKLQPLLRKAVDKFTRKNLKSPSLDGTAILALYIVSKFILFPKDELSEDPRPKAPQGLDDGLLEFSTDLSPRLVIRVARKIALDLGYYQSCLEIGNLRDSYQAENSTSNSESIRETYHKKLLQTVVWLGLSQADHSIDIIQGLPDLITFEKEYDRQLVEPNSSQILPPPDFLPAQEQLRLIWIVSRSELFSMTSKYKREWDETIPNLEDEVQLSRKVHEPSKKISAWMTTFDEQFGRIASEFELDSTTRRHLSLLSDVAHMEAFSIRCVLSDCMLWPIARNVKFGGKAEDGSTLMLPQIFTRGNASLPGYLLMEFCGLEGIQNCEKAVSIVGSGILLPTGGDEELVDTGSSASSSLLPFPTLGSIPPDTMAFLLHSFFHMIETQVSVADSWAMLLHDVPAQSSILMSLIRGIDALRREVTIHPNSDQEAALKFKPMNPRCDSIFQALKLAWTTWQAEKRIRFSGGGAIQTETFSIESTRDSASSLPSGPGSKLQSSHDLERSSSGSPLATITGAIQRFCEDSPQAQVDRRLAELSDQASDPSARQPQSSLGSPISYDHTSPQGSSHELLNSYTRILTPKSSPEQAQSRQQLPQIQPSHQSVQVPTLQQSQQQSSLPLSNTSVFSGSHSGHDSLSDRRQSMYDMQASGFANGMEPQESLIFDQRQSFQTHHHQQGPVSTNHQQFQQNHDVNNQSWFAGLPQVGDYPSVLNFQSTSDERLGNGYSGPFHNSHQYQPNSSSHHSNPHDLLQSYSDQSTQNGHNFFYNPHPQPQDPSTYHFQQQQQQQQHRFSF